MTPIGSVRVVATKPIRIKRGPKLANDSSSRFTPSPKINASRPIKE